MLNTNDILQTIRMIREENLDIRTVTMGISLFDCVSDDGNRLCDNIYDKITRKAEKLVATGQDIEKKYGIPIVNKRVSVTPISLVAGNALIGAAEHPGLACAHIDLNVVTDGDGLHNAFDIVIAVGPLAQNIQCKIDLGKCAFI